jgi:hypothetical protein
VPRRLLRLAKSDVDVDNRTSERAVAHGAADDPRLLAGE